MKLRPREGKGAKLVKMFAEMRQHRRFRPREGKKNRNLQPKWFLENSYSEVSVPVRGKRIETVFSGGNPEGVRDVSVPVRGKRIKTKRWADS